MKKVKMIIKKTTTHRVECELIDSVANRLIAGDYAALTNACPELATEENIIDGNYEIEDLEVME